MALELHYNRFLFTFTLWGGEFYTPLTLSGGYQITY